MDHDVVFEPQMPLRDVVTLSRVQTQVNKTAIIAFAQSDSTQPISLASLSDDYRSTNGTQASHHDSTTHKLKYIRINFIDVSRRL
jgi:hypothetical protein